MAQIDSLSLENFRVFNKEFSMDIAPITFLTGPNSSGKSSIFKSLLLLKSNYNSSLQVLDFSGKNHNLGTFDTALNKRSGDSNLIYFSFTSNLSYSEYFRPSSFVREPITTKRSVYSILHERISKESSKIKIKLGYRKVDASGKLSEILMYQAEDKLPFLTLTIAKDEHANHYLKFDYDLIKKNSVIKSIFFHEEIIKNNIKVNKIDKVKPYFIDSKFKLVSGKNSKFYDEPILVFGKLFEIFLSENTTYSSKRDGEIHELFLKRPMSRLLRDFSSLIDHTDYLEAVRANTKRLYTNDSQGTSFNDLILEFQSRDLSKAAIDFLNKWLRKFEIADKISFENVEGVATSIYLINGEHKTALADLGYGVTQFIPILLKIAMEHPVQKNNGISRIVKKLILLEEPETNLHPKLQSLLADFLVDAINTFEVKFIVETHSEYIIRKAQILTAEKEITSNDTVIYYFINPNNVTSEEEQIKRINIKKNGMLDNDFGEGFFDEATKMKFELLKLKSQ